MAPGLVDPVADRTVDVDAETIAAKDKHQGAYKEAFAQGPKSTNYEAELKGTAKHPPAKYPNYLPYWDD
ncbi:hypothetical protein LTR53_016053, partial [Teratosphaeriaceae sp. CCFEE 6253]